MYGRRQRLAGLRFRSYFHRTIFPSAPSWDDPSDTHTLCMSPGVYRSIHRGESMSTPGCNRDGCETLAAAGSIVFLPYLRAFVVRVVKTQTITVNEATTLIKCTLLPLDLSPTLSAPCLLFQRGHRVRTLLKLVRAKCLQCQCIKASTTARPLRPNFNLDVCTRSPSQPRVSYIV